MADVEVLVAIGIGVLTLVILLFLVFGRGRTRRPNILINGICDSGKTVLFVQLTKDMFKQTHTSLQENKGSVDVKGTSVAVIDIPGHERLREQMLEKYMSTCRALVFVVDSSTVVKEIKDVAEYLYTLLTDVEIAKGKVPVLIACNKQDLPFTKSSAVIQSLLEKELTTVRKTKSAGLAGTDGTTTKRCQLGSEGADFQFSQLPQRVEVVECSAKGSSPEGNEPELEEVKRWIQTV